MKADVTGLPVVTLEGADAAVRGDAMLAGVAAGLFGSLEEARAAMVVARDTFAPDPGRYAAYDAAYRRYLELFEALRPTYERPVPAGS
jgi:sugar (pentulose or hexulose) kinase